MSGGNWPRQNVKIKLVQNKHQAKIRQEALLSATGRANSRVVTVFMLSTYFVLHLEIGAKKKMIGGCKRKKLSWGRLCASY